MEYCGCPLGMCSCGLEEVELPLTEVKESFKTFESPFIKELALTSQKVYKAKLTFLAKSGYPTLDSLLINSEEVINLIREKYPEDTDKSRYARRIILSAIFAVMPDDLRKKRNPYYDFYQKNMPSKNSNGKDWVKREDYVKPEDSSS